MCVAVEGRFLRAGDVAGLRAAARRAEAEGAAAIFLSGGPLGDPVVLAAGLSRFVPRLLIGARVGLADSERHPTVLAREFTALDHVCAGRSVLCLLPPFSDRTAEAIALCRAMWRDGTATTDGPHYRVAGAVNRPGPPGEGSPLVALDLTGAGAQGATGGPPGPPDVHGLADLLLLPGGAPNVCTMVRP